MHSFAKVLILILFLAGGGVSAQTLYNLFPSTGKIGVNLSTSGATPHAAFQFRNDARSISMGPMETF